MARPSHMVDEEWRRRLIQDPSFGVPGAHESYRKMTELVCGEHITVSVSMPEYVLLRHYRDFEYLGRIG